MRQVCTKSLLDPRVREDDDLYVVSEAHVVGYIRSSRCFERNKGSVRAALL